MSGKAHPYPLDLEALPLGSVVVAVDCWGDQPLALRVVERTQHHITGRSAAGVTIIAGAPLVRRMATADEEAAFQPSNETKPLTRPAAQPARQAPQMELF